MAEPRALLVEIGTEELPPKALAALSAAFAQEICAGLDQRQVEHGAALAYATPRRLAVLVHAVADAQPDRETVRRGPALAAAFDADGTPTRAAIGFARSAGVEVDQLDRIETEKGTWLGLRSTEIGEPTTALVPHLVDEALGRLPVPRRMHWADLDVEFARPVHWVVLLYGDEVVEGEVLGIGAGRMTRGHRFHHPQALPIDSAGEYADRLRDQGYVIAAIEERRTRIREGVEAAADALGARAEIEPALLDETAALTEWPVAVAGSFDQEYLELPDAVLVATMRDHQRYFPVRDRDGRLLAHFVTVSNIESRNPGSVRAGNERVIRPRFADARFFFRGDLETPLAARREALAQVVFQERLGSVGDKSQRVARLAGHVAIALGVGREEVQFARRAAELGKCDLLTQMVFEFPELQGEIGAEYARRGGEPEPVATAIGESYLPRFAGDSIPASAVGRALAIADKLDTVVGIFGIGEPPGGDRDPYALRRAALGIMRILIEGELPLELPKLIEAAVAGYGDLLSVEGVAAQVMDFALDRLRGYFAEQQVPADVVAAVRARQPTRPHDFARRVLAVDRFRRLPEAESLAAANKRIGNILRQADAPPAAAVDEALLGADAEWDLAARLVGLGPQVRRLIESGDYGGALERLAALRDAVDAFFDNVRVMDDDPAVRANRLALLASIHELFLAIADISRLSGS